MRLLGINSGDQKGLNPLLRLQDEMERVFDRFGRQNGFELAGQETFEPRVEIQDKGKTYKVKVEVPGMEEKDVKVSLVGNDTLVIEGERSSEKESGDETNFASEFSYGSFYREIPLANEVNEETISARYKNGVLVMHLDKLHPGKDKIKSIPISAS
jgi:HSP20 family protein